MAANARRREGSWWRKHYQPPRTPRIGYMKRLIAYHRGRAKRQAPAQALPGWVMFPAVMLAVGAGLAVIGWIAIGLGIAPYWPVGK